MSLGNDLDKLARSQDSDLEVLCELRDRARESHRPLFSPAIGEHAVTRLLPELEEENRVLRDSVESLTLDLDRAHAQIAILMQGIRALGNGSAGSEGW